jgi:hypothetical protein
MCNLKERNASQPVCKSPSSPIIIHHIHIPDLFHDILYIAEPAPFCTCVKYCLLVVFHAAMYFSMQLV